MGFCNETGSNYQSVVRIPGSGYMDQELPIPNRRATIMFDFGSLLLDKIVLVFHYHGESLMPPVGLSFNVRRRNGPFIQLLWRSQRYWDSL